MPYNFHDKGWSKINRLAYQFVVWFLRYLNQWTLLVLHISYLIDCVFGIISHLLTKLNWNLFAIWSSYQSNDQSQLGNGRGELEKLK